MIPVGYPKIPIAKELWQGKDYGLARADVVGGAKVETIRGDWRDAEVEDVVVTLLTFMQRSLAEDGRVLVARSMRRCRRYVEVKQCR